MLTYLRTLALEAKYSAGSLNGLEKTAQLNCVILELENMVTSPDGLIITRLFLTFPVVLGEEPGMTEIFAVLRAMRLLKLGAETDSLSEESTSESLKERVQLILQVTLSKK
jgi:hypothetical protein